MSTENSSTKKSCVDLERRRFMKMAAMACVACSAATVLQACGVESSTGGDGSSSTTATTVDVDGSGNVVISLSDYSDLDSVGGYVRLAATGFNGDRDFLVVQTDSGEYQAMTTRCTHEGGTLRNPSSGLAICSAHGAEFSVDSGTFGQWQGGTNASDISPLTVTYDSGAGTLTISDA